MPPTNHNRTPLAGPAGRVTLRLGPGAYHLGTAAPLQLNLTLTIAPLAETLRVSAGLLRQSNVMTTEEALRKVPGVHAEDAFGLRPNDGLPLSYAPYGDNASYYHPPIDRFDSVEVLKGGEQILFGPMTIGGV
ncbi:MAG: TonB-dependent receptor plug domain-containing protein, partial [Acidobacteriota bacterium]